MPDIMSDVLLSAYETIVASLGAGTTDVAIVAALVRDGEWTEQGAQEVMWLARRYGTGILRNALALASALEIDDRNSGL